MAPRARRSEPSTSPSTPTTKTEVDWFFVEKEFRAGIRPLRDIAADASITEGAIRKRAKRDQWTRASREKVLGTRTKPRVALVPKDEMSSAGFLYVIYIDSGVRRFYKIGMAKRFDARFDQHQCASPFDICVATCYFTANMRLEERCLHAAFREKHVRGEWYELNDADLAEIAQRALLV